MSHTLDFDVIIVGGGHAGIEAAYAAAKMGSRTALITLKIDKIGLMPCNPSVGGVGKGHIVHEISALGGLMPQLCTKTYLQARMLNESKGPAVHGLRLQIDKFAYNKASCMALQSIPNLTICEGSVDDIIIDNNNGNRARGVILASGATITASTIVLTTGTFLNGLIHIGASHYSAGRQGENAVHGLSVFLKKMNLKLGRLKTGTPPRLLRESLDFSKMEEQHPDQLEYLFEFYPHAAQSTRACYITRTNKKTHDIIRTNIKKSALYGGIIQGTGPRYCPSIEDKVMRFADKESHQIFVEPEGADCNEVYPSGLSTSLPEDIQKEYIQSIVGFENAHITKPGYAVEYDFVLPHQLKKTLEVITIPGLFLAGQINGTTGYEEAAGQGIIAGINAHCTAHNQKEFILDRTESYIGIMIDDLVTMSVDEPYRMFTSRAEYRLRLRQDNSFLRLTDRAYDLGLISEHLYHDFCQEKESITQARAYLAHDQSAKTELNRLIHSSDRNLAMIRDFFQHHCPDLFLSGRALCVIEGESRYEPYYAREDRAIKQREQYKTIVIPDNFSFKDLPGLSKELQEKLEKYKPKTIADAALIPGMTPAALSLLIFAIHHAYSRT